MCIFTVGCTAARVIIICESRTSPRDNNNNILNSAIHIHRYIILYYSVQQMRARKYSIEAPIVCNGRRSNTYFFQFRIVEWARYQAFKFYIVKKMY